MKILVTGAGGGLGHELRPVFGDHDLVLLDRANLDVTKVDQVEEALDRHRPGAVIHCAAYTDVDGAEAAPAEVELINHQATAELAKATAQREIVLYYPSTDYVFDGKKDEPYVEDDFAEPLSVYGHSKLKGETAALSANGRTRVIRTSWLYSQHGKSFVTTMLKLFEQQKELKIVSDEVSSPTYARDFARALHAMIERDVGPGIYHAACEGETSWYEFAEEIARQSTGGRGYENIHPITAAEWGAAAARPKYSKLDTAKLADGGINLPSWQDSLANFFADREAA